MGIIYVLQKDVPGLGRLTKIGMTTRSGEDRAAEYGGGGWEVVDELSVSVDEPYQLQEIEGRIHDRLERYRCGPAVGFGLTEVFTCSAEEALAAARAEIGSRADDADRVQRVRQRTNKMVERKIMQTHAAAVARLHMGKYEEPDHSDRHRYDIPFGAKKGEIAEWLIHQKALEALDKIAAEAPTFRAMLKGDLAAIRQRWDETEKARLQREQDEKVAAAERIRVAEKKREEKRLSEEQRNRLRAELATHAVALADVKKSLDACENVIFVGVIVALLSLTWFIGDWTTNHRLDGYGLFWVILVSAFTATVYLRRRQIKTHLVEMHRNWDEAH
jgi:predicted phage tail protein